MVTVDIYEEERHIDGGKLSDCNHAAWKSDLPCDKYSRNVKRFVDNSVVIVLKKRGKKKKKKNNYLIWAPLPPCLSLSPQIPPIPIDIQGIESSAIEIRTTSSACLDKEATGVQTIVIRENTTNRHWKWSGDKREYAHGTHAIEPSLISVWLDIQPAPILGVFSFYSVGRIT